MLSGINFYICTSFMSVFVVDDHPLMREAVATLVHRLTPGTPVIELENVAAIAQAVEGHGAPVLICMDLKLPDTEGLPSLRELKRYCPDVPVVVLTSLSAVDYEDLALQAGAVAYIEKSAASTQVMDVLQTFLNLEQEVKAPVSVQKLSKRQKQLLHLLDKGQSNRDIAESLQISEHTVKVHLWRMFRRLNVKSRSQASHLARTQGLL